MAKKSAKDREEELRIWESNPVYLTPEGLKELQNKLARLKERHPEIIREVARTAAYGDRSDNAEYKAAKSRLRGAQRHIAEMEDQLRKVKIIPSGPSATGKVQMGSTVIVESKEGRKMKFRIVGPEEANPEKGFISQVSPLGASLIGHAQQEKISFQAGMGTKEYRILEIF